MVIVIDLGRLLLYIVYMYIENLISMFVWEFISILYILYIILNIILIVCMRAREGGFMI